MDQFFKCSIRDELFLKSVESSLDEGEFSPEGGLLEGDRLAGTDFEIFELLEEDGNVVVLISFGGVSFSIS